MTITDLVVESTTKPGTAPGMLDMLRGHLGGAPSNPDPGFFIREIQAPESTRRADALWVPLDSQHRGQLWGFEIKISRSDVLAELSDPTKADAWLRYCDRWWLCVADPRHVDGLDIPGHWGILAPPSGRSKRLMTVIRQAPELKPAARDVAFATIMSRLYFGSDVSEGEIRELRSRLDREVDETKRIRALLESANRELDVVGRMGESERRAADLIKAVENEADIWRADPAVVARYVADGEAARRLDRELTQKLEHIQRQLEVMVSNNVGALLPKIKKLRKRLAEPTSIHSTKETNV
jgi:hypothetical protein